MTPPTGQGKKCKWEDCMYFDNGCLHITDKALMDAINAHWPSNQADWCIVDDSGGGGAGTNSMCNCRRGKNNENVKN